MRRSEQRRQAVFALYQHDLTGRPLMETLEADASPFTRSLAHAAADLAPTGRADRTPRPRLERHADRALERSILRIALVEMLQATPSRRCDRSRPRGRSTRP